MKKNKRKNAVSNEEKPKDFKVAIQKLLKYNKSYVSLIIIALILSMISSILAIIGPDKLKDMTNVITKGLLTGIDTDKIKSIGIVLICFYAASLIFNYIQGLIMAIVTNKFSKNMRREISIKINKLPLAYFDKTTIGDILSRVTNDVDTIGQTLNDSIGSLVSSITMFLGSLFMMFYTNWILAITAIVSTIIGFVLMATILSRSQKYFSNLQKEIGNMNGHIEEVYSGHNVVKVYNAKKEVDEEFDLINERLFINGKKSQFYSGLMPPLMGFIGNFGYVAVCVVGALLTMNNVISFGVIVAFMIYIRLFSQPLTNIAQCLNELQSTAAASERVFEFLEAPEMADESNKKIILNKASVKGNIEFKNIKFGYTKDKEIIKGFSSKIKAGEKVAIVGPTGAGKTTIVNLLMRFYEIDSGDILIDGISTKELTRDNIHNLFTMVLQDTWLFEGSIKENIRYNQDSVTDDEIINACKVVGLDHFIRTLPKGYDTILNDVDSLSAGQKQLLTIARCMVLNTPFLILDEATSNVDTRTEILVQEAMDKLTKGRTSFIIAHRLSTIKNADLILVLKDGNIIEQGNHKTLLEKNGFYAELYNSQFENACE
ncbi:MAG: ABC transporter ATP-binding protein [Bacilli bacterium]|nr:ABC transporter ATP-binding protein [Bacilli bacterium]